MLAAVKGIVQGNTVVIEDEDIRDYNGTEVIVTLLEEILHREKQRKHLLTGIVLLFQAKEGKHVDEYMKEMRENDRL